MTGDDVVRGLADACRREDIAALRAAFDTDAVAVCDGGGRVPAPRSPVRGAEEVARLVLWIVLNSTKLRAWHRR